MEPIVHFIVPFIALTLVDVEFGKALPISFLAVLPDLDALFLVHRSLSHSIVVMSIVIAPFILLTYRFKPRLHGYVWLALFAVASHLVLDVFTGYTPILWPLYGYSLWVQAELMVHIDGSASLSSSVKLLTKPITFQPFQSLDASLLTGGGLILSAVLLMPVFFKAFKTWWRRARYSKELVSD